MTSKYVDEERGQGRYPSDNPVKARISSNPTSETDSAIRGRLRMRTAESHPRLHALNCTDGMHMHIIEHTKCFRSTWYGERHMIYVCGFKVSDSAEIETFTISLFWTGPNETWQVSLRDKV